jgi:hypothetical protein
VTTGPRVTTVTATPFVNTPFGVGVVEGSVKRLSPAGDEVFVRFEDGSRRWVLAAACDLDAERPDWYREPETAEIAEYVR